MTHSDSVVLQWCQSNSEKILNYYLPNVAIENVFSQSDLLEKGNYVIEPERHGDGSPQAFIDICFGDNYAKAMDEIHSNYASYVSYAEKISNETVFLDVQVLSDDATKTIMFLFTDFVENRKNKDNKEDINDIDDIDVNNACVESIVDLINTYKEVNDWFIVNKEHIVIDFKDVLKTQDLSEINQILNDFPICHDVIVPEITLNYGNIYKTVKLKLKTNNVSVNLYNNGGGIGEKTGNVIGFEFYHKDLGEMDWENATKACADLGDGWRLPTKDELNLIYINKDEIGGFASDYYWSSTEYDNNYAWGQYFDDGDQDNANKYGKYDVRAVRDVHKKVKLVDGGGIKDEISDERKAHYLKDGQKILVDTNFVQQSQGKFPNSELKHYGYGDFFLQTENGNISFFRTGNEIDGFSGRSHKLEGDIDLVNKLLDNMSLAGILQEVKIKEL
jgi:Protein of unknown function (DUF1566)